MKNPQSWLLLYCQVKDLQRCRMCYCLCFSDGPREEAPRLLKKPTYLETMLAQSGQLDSFPWYLCNIIEKLQAGVSLGLVTIFK